MLSFQAEALHQSNKRGRHHEDADKGHKFFCVGSGGMRRGWCKLFKCCKQCGVSSDSLVMYAHRMETDT